MRRGFFSLGFLMASLMGVSILVVSAKSYASECSNNPENNYCWYGYKLSLGKYTTPRELCDVIIKDVRSTPEYPNAVLLSMTGSGNRFYCNYKVFISHPNTYSVPLSREGSSCGPDGTYNIATGECEIPAESLPRKQKGVPDTDVCGVAGNPINLSVGNKFQVEIDYSASMSPLKFIRYYNSLDGVWTHSYSSHLIIAKQGVVLVLADGRQVIFSLAGGVITPEASERGRLEKLSNGWVFYSFDNERMRFDDLGRLIFLVDALGRMQTITYASTTSAAVTDEIGNTLKFTSDELYQPKTLQVSNLSFSYTYNSQRLVKLARTVNGQTQSRTYHYGVNSQPLLLTGITDERGIRYATWTYDDQGRAISSEHANGAEKVTLSYNADG
ncbi:DUF6531 domain-containing protein, partial [Pseudomonas indica]|uniref:DUF6531 domain-containing protein n=1 Tax=Pseudomonas indica TaxID=137658 RepID=UPI0023F7458D